jgi:hypothetical protein
MHLMRKKPETRLSQLQLTPPLPSIGVVALPARLLGFSQLDFA